MSWFGQEILLASYPAGNLRDTVTRRRGKLWGLRDRVRQGHKAARRHQKCRKVWEW